ncbi:hypothetical protein NPIL_156311 [Nephila pilipes]|uniref:Uncharacterized protein n=1 Tax=Nephila pilipes TaxID=299642 RepID=A0A8X6THI1_NEPPI|nr:hypothetical protein NPIL_156311 [Nephila pilipes]
MIKENYSSGLEKVSVLLKKLDVILLRFRSVLCHSSLTAPHTLVIDASKIAVVATMQHTSNVMWTSDIRHLNAVTNPYKYLSCSKTVSRTVLTFWRKRELFLKKLWLYISSN